MRLSDRQIEWAREQLQEYLPRKERPVSFHPLSSGDFYHRAISFTEFLSNLQGMLESIARRERRQALLRALAKFAEALRIEGD